MIVYATNNNKESQNSSLHSELDNLAQTMLNLISDYQIEDNFEIAEKITGVKTLKISALKTGLSRLNHEKFKNGEYPQESLKMLTEIYLYLVDHVIQNVITPKIKDIKNIQSIDKTTIINQLEDLKNQLNKIDNQYLDNEINNILADKISTVQNHIRSVRSNEPKLPRELRIGLIILIVIVLIAVGYIFLIKPDEIDKEYQEQDEMYEQY